VRNEHQALHDALTGLANRVLFRRDVETALVDGTAAVIVMDLDRFKEVNDTLGHGHGDLLLVAVARRLRPVLSDDATLARLGGDEFAVLLPDAGPDEAADVARHLLDAVRAPFDVEGMALEVGTSIGVARAPEDGEDVETLLKRADIAMYKAKEQRIGWLRYAPHMDDRTPERLVLVAELRRAIEAKELVLHYQPKLDLVKRRVTSVEALVRWPHPVRGMVSPGEFIPLAEHTGLIRPLTDWVLGEAVAQAARWEAAKLPLRVAVNISSRSLLEERFAEGVAALLLRHRVKPSLLELEITESVLLADPEKAERVLIELDTFGVRLSIDDFGTGYSSLGYLKRLPVHVLKIDRSFVSDMIESASDHAIVASTVTLSRNLDLEVVAEGVEDDATMVELSRLGCHMAQGFGISRPVPAADLDTWMRRDLNLPKELGQIGAPVRSLSSVKSRR
jgi:diguanylate cyclase (GGDEF)-like protein